MELAADRSACLWILVLSCCQWLYHITNRRFGVFFFFFFWLWTTGGGDSHLSSSLSQLRSHSLNSDHRPTKLATDQSAWLWNPWSSLLIGVLACGYWFFHAANGCITLPIRDLGVFFFFFLLLLWTSGGGGVDGSCGCGCEEKDWRFWFFFFFFSFFLFCCILVVVLMVVVGVVMAVVVFVSDDGIYYFIGVIILFYWDVYIILLC